MKRSYKALELKPYIRAAESFIQRHKADREIGWSLDRIASMLANAGPVQRVSDLPWLPLRVKARASLAMLREKPVPASRILAVTLGVLAVIEEDTWGPGGDRVLWRRVQIAKALRRRASGTHVVYSEKSRLDQYQRSSGRVLEKLGAMVEEAAEFAISAHLPAVLTLKQERYGVLPIAPEGNLAKSRHGNTMVPPPPQPAVSLWAQTKTAQREAEEREADKIAAGLREAFAKEGYAAFGRKEQP